MTQSHSILLASCAVLASCTFVQRETAQTALDSLTPVAYASDAEARAAAAALIDDVDVAYVETGFTEQSDLPSKGVAAYEGFIASADIDLTSITTGQASLGIDFGAASGAAAEGRVYNLVNSVSGPFDGTLKIDNGTFGTLADPINGVDPYGLTADLYGDLTDATGVYYVDGMLVMAFTGGTEYLAVGGAGTITNDADVVDFVAVGALEKQ